jgi:hypothetical protein
MVKPIILGMPRAPRRTYTILGLQTFKKKLATYNFHINLERMYL